MAMPLFVNQPTDLFDASADNDEPADAQAAETLPTDPSVFVGGLPYSVTQELFSELCVQCGPVEGVRLLTDASGASKGVGFADFPDMASAAYAYVARHEQTACHCFVRRCSLPRRSGHLDEFAAAGATCWTGCASAGAR